MSGRVGRNGVRALSSRREGDGTTPGGVFPIGTMTAPNGDNFTMFGNGSRPSGSYSWHQVQPGDCWWSTPGDARYNTLVQADRAACGTSNEYLPSYQNTYAQAIVIGANMGPNRSGDQAGEPALASAIFMHTFNFDGSGNTVATAGCVSVSSAHLAGIMAQMTPDTYFVITP